MPCHLSIDIQPYYTTNKERKPSVYDVLNEDKL